MSDAQRELALAVCGVGKMGVMHAAMISALPAARVAAIVDPDSRAARQLTGMGAAAPVFASIEDAARGVALDAATIAAPSFAHRPIAEAALELGLHVFCEKPLAHTLADARALADAARARPDRRCAIGFMKGHQGLFLESARMLREGVLGEPRRFRASVYLSQVFGPMKGWTFTKERAGGGVLINTGIHLIHLCSMLFGRAVSAVCRARPMHSGVEDTLAAIVEYEGGVFGSIDMSWSVPGYDVEYSQILVEGSNGVLDLDDFRARLHLLEARGGAPKGWSETHQSQTDRAAFSLTPEYCGEGYCQEIADFCAAIREGRRPRYDFADGLEMQRVVDALYRSAESGERIALSPPAGLAGFRPGGVAE
ncbi:MAG: Glucose--fructose oxidoreductase precursor [candidate division BRC1 bacterium ADurb.BinA364]|nr:MAG: Glucose--fructose oxidoreductase precursor [candidate division BRC1 bacterium ADurb.BinA364]